MEVSSSRIQFGGRTVLHSIILDITRRKLYEQQIRLNEQRQESLVRIFKYQTLCFSVRDTGIGIPAGKIDRLFKEFSQVDCSTTRQYGGTGLGLSISKQLAELMGGEIGVTSEEGKGSEFWFTVRFNKQAVRADMESIPPGDLHGVRVLIVDDSATSREIPMTANDGWT